MAEKNYKFRGTGLTPAEKKWAGRRFKEYQKHFHVNSFSDSQLLEELVYRETIQERCKKEIHDKNKDKKGVITKIPGAFNDNLELILELKEKLGLFRDKKEDEYKAFEVLGKKLNVYKDEHIEEFEVDCPFCSMKFFLNRRTDKYQPSKLVLFKNKVLCNSTLWRIYKEKKITKEEFAEILNVSKNYIDWLEEKIYSKPSK